MNRREKIAFFLEWMKPDNFLDPQTTIHWLQVNLEISLKKPYSSQFSLILNALVNFEHEENALLCSKFV